MYLVITSESQKCYVKKLEMLKNKSNNWFLVNFLE